MRERKTEGIKTGLDVTLSTLCSCESKFHPPPTSTPISYLKDPLLRERPAKLRPPYGSELRRAAGAPKTVSSLLQEDDAQDDEQLIWGCSSSRNVLHVRQPTRSG
jgi:hypothetical protein